MLICARTSLPQRKNTLPVKVGDQSFIIPLHHIIEVSLMKTIKANEVTYIKRLETDKRDRDRVSLLRIIRMDLKTEFWVYRDLLSLKYV